MSSLEYNFTNAWFNETENTGVWDSLFAQLKPTRVLEIGCFEGRSTSYLIEKLASCRDIEVHCVDTWERGEDVYAPNGLIEHEWTAVEERFHYNIKVAQSKVSHVAQVIIHKSFSDRALPKLLAEGKAGYFDFIYIDGSHQASDVLCDAVLSFRLLRGGEL